MNPAPPASTTPASFNTGNNSGVLANAARPASRATRNMPTKLSPLPAAATAASAVSRTTVRMVPSIGFNTASYEATLAAFNAAATSGALATPPATPRNLLTIPRITWLRITPLFPRAPINDPWAMASHVPPMSTAAPSSSFTTASRVRAMLVPVSPSGTGYTFRRLMPSMWARSVVRNVIRVSRRASAPRDSSMGINKSYRFTPALDPFHTLKLSPQSLFL